MILKVLNSIVYIQLNVNVNIKAFNLIDICIKLKYKSHKTIILIKNKLNFFIYLFIYK